MNLDVAEIADDKDLGMAGWHRCSQSEALGRWDQRIVAAVDQQKIGAQISELATREVEILDVATHRLGQGCDQLRHALWIGIAHQRDHGPTVAVELRLEVANIGVGIGELGVCDLAQERTILRLRNPRGTGEDEHPFGARLRRCRSAKAGQGLADSSRW